MRIEVAAQEKEMEAEEERCRLCLGGEEDGNLVQLCGCRGSARLVHRHCLERWRRTSPNQDAAYRCGECKDEYRDALSLELLRARLQAERTGDGSIAFTLDRLAQELEDQGKYDEAEPLYREALQLQRATLGDRHLETLTSIGNLGLLQVAKGDLAAAELLLREALQGSRETLGDRHSHTLGCINNFGMLRKAKGDLAAAEPLYREALDVQRETLGSRHPNTIISMSNLGTLLKSKGDLGAAEPLYREALDSLRETLGYRHPNTLAATNNLGCLMQDMGDLTSAEPLLHEALAVQRETLGDRHPDTLTSINNHGLLLQAKGDLAAAEPLIREAVKGRHETLGSRHPSTLACRNNLGRLLQANAAANELLLYKAITMMHKNSGSRLLHMSGFGQLHRPEKKPREETPTSLLAVLAPRRRVTRYE